MVISSGVLSVAAWAVGKPVPEDQGQVLIGYHIANSVRMIFIFFTDTGNSTDFILCWEECAKYSPAKTITSDKNENMIHIRIGAYTSPKAGDWFAGHGYQFVTPNYPLRMIVSS